MATSWWLNTSQCPCSVKPWVLHGISCFDPFLGSRKSKSNSWMLWCFFGGKFQGDPKGSTEIRIKTKTNSFQKAIKNKPCFFFDFPAPLDPTYFEPTGFQWHARPLPQTDATDAFEGFRHLGRGVPRFVTVKHRWFGWCFLYINNDGWVESKRFCRGEWIF